MKKYRYKITKKVGLKTTTKKGTFYAADYDSALKQILYAMNCKKEELELEEL